MSKNAKSSSAVKSNNKGLVIGLVAFIAILVIIVIVALFVNGRQYDKEKEKEKRPQTQPQTESIVSQLKKKAVDSCQSYNNRRTNESKNAIIEIMDSAISKKTIAAQSGNKWNTDGWSLNEKEDIKSYTDAGNPNAKLPMPERDCWLEITGDGKFNYAVYYNFATVLAKVDAAKAVGFGENSSIAIDHADGKFYLVALSGDNKTGRPYYIFSGQASDDNTESDATDSNSSGKDKEKGSDVSIQAFSDDGVDDTVEGYRIKGKSLWEVTVQACQNYGGDNPNCLSTNLPSGDVDLYIRPSADGTRLELISDSTGIVVK